MNLRPIKARTVRLPCSFKLQIRVILAKYKESFSVPFPISVDFIAIIKRTTTNTGCCIFATFVVYTRM